MNKKGINKITGSLRLEKTYKITKPRLPGPQSIAQSYQLISQAAPRAQEPSGALWRGGITLGVRGLPQPREHFHSFDRCHGQSEPRACWHRPSCSCGKAPSLGRKRKSALNPCVSKEVSGKNTSPARMLSNFFLFFLLNRSYLYFQSSKVVKTGSGCLELRNHTGPSPACKKL